MIYSFAVCKDPQDLQSVLVLAEVAAYFPHSCIAGTMQFDTASMRSSYATLLHSGSLQRGVVRVDLVSPKVPWVLSIIDLPGKKLWLWMAFDPYFCTEWNQHWASEDEHECQGLASHYARKSNTLISVLYPPIDPGEGNIPRLASDYLTEYLALANWFESQLLTKILEEGSCAKRMIGESPS